MSLADSRAKCLFLSTIVATSLVVPCFGSLKIAVKKALPATLPQATVDTSLPAGWDGPADATPANSAELVLALANAVQNSGTYVIELAAGTTYTGNFFIENKPGSDWLIIRTAGWKSSPPVAEGVRVTPADAPSMARLFSPNKKSIFRAGLGAHHIRFVGVEFAVDAPIVPLVILGYASPARSPQVESEIAHHIGFDRCWIHSTSETNRSRVGLHVSVNHFFVINSRIDNIKDSADAQAVYSASSQGPHLIENNTLEATGENIMYGGDATPVDQLVGSDITILRNHLTKRPEWNKWDPAFNGIDWSIKNLFELKNARRVYFHSNVLENNWKDKQVGYAIVLTPRNGWGSLNPWAQVKDVTIENNIIRNTGRLFFITSEDDAKPTGTLERVTIRNNLVYSQGGLLSGVSGRHFNINIPSNGRPVKDLIIDHNTFVFSEGHLGNDSIQPKRSGAVNVNGFQLTNNLFDDGNYDDTFRWFERIANRTVSGNGIFFNPSANGYARRTNRVRFGQNFGAGNFKANTIDDVRFTDHANLDYTLANDSPFKGILDGKDPGVDFAVLNKAIAGVVLGVSKPGPMPKPKPKP